jgi:hypothetical protein
MRQNPRTGRFRVAVLFNFALLASVTAFHVTSKQCRPSFMTSKANLKTKTSKIAAAPVKNNNKQEWLSMIAAVSIAVTSAFGTTNGVAGVAPAFAVESTTATAASTEKSYDGFAEYAKENKMEQSDVGCFVNQCGEETKNLFKNPRGIKGVSCLGRCKGEQACATRCFAEFGSEDLNAWLSCTIEDKECVKVPKNVDNSAENTAAYAGTVTKFDPSSLVGNWYKTDGLNPNYDLFDCQSNAFTVSPTSTDGIDGKPTELDMGIFFRVNRPAGGYWENDLTEHMVIDAVLPKAEKAAAASETDPGRTMHTSGKMYGLIFEENWYIVGESDGSKDIPEFKLVAYRGHTLQGNYEGAFVYAKESKLPAAAVPAVREAAAKAGLNFGDFTRIDNAWYVLYGITVGIDELASFCFASFSPPLFP